MVRIRTEENTLLLLGDGLIRRPLIGIGRHKVLFVAVDGEREVLHLKTGRSVAFGTFLLLAAELDTKAACCSCHMAHTIFTLGHLESILHFMTALEQR